MEGGPKTYTRDNGPGPGSYELDKGKGKGGIKFGKDTRSGLNNSSSKFVPGPGTYGSDNYESKRYNAPKYTYYLC